MNASVNHNVLVSLAPGVQRADVDGSMTRSIVRRSGYPLYGLWAQPRDVRGREPRRDHRAERGHRRDSDEYIGPSLPTQEVSVSTHLALWRARSRSGGLVDYRGGYRIANAVAYYADTVGNTPGTNDPTAPLWLQARAVANAILSVHMRSMSRMDHSCGCARCR